ncbi:MAG: histidinol dehydrogenase [Gammaproteobacteria bacterium]
MTAIRNINSTDSDFREKLDSLLTANDELGPELTRTVMDILEAVRNRGDTALVEYTNRFDNRDARIAELELNPNQLVEAAKYIPDELQHALEEAARRIRSYHEKQLMQSWTYEDSDGVMLGQQVTALDKVGVYVPGGKAAYPSTVLMNVIPARVAGVGEIIMTVPAPGGELDSTVLAAAHIAGVDRVFTIGGAQAVGALAYGTESVPAVDKIVGPGNKYVATAKRLVFGIVGIDMVAGPSEVLIISDGSGDPDWVAMDLFAQAEHDEDARAILVCNDEGFIQSVTASIERLLPEMERAGIIHAALENEGALIQVKDLEEAVEVANLIAPEHLELAVNEPDELLPRIRHAGAIFIGHWAAESMGDYCAGPNHVLPTARTARFSSPLGVYDFQKRSSLIRCDRESSKGIASIASVLARCEGLTAHARSAEYRLNETEK